MPLFAWAVILILAQPLSAQWPMFRGPNASGIGDTGTLPAEFGPTKNVVWKVALPPGHSSPVIAAGRVYLTASDGDKLETICLDEKTGSILWRKESPRARKEPLHKLNNPASPSPLTDGKRVWVWFPDYGLLAYDKDGRELWRTPLGPFENVYGMGSSPNLFGKTLVLSCDQSRGSFIAGFDADTGKQKWRRPRPEALSGHATPVAYAAKDGRTQVLVPGSFRMDAYDPESGEAIWWVTGLPSEMKSVAVLNADQTTVYVSGFNSPDNEPGKIRPPAPFEEVLKTADKDKDGQISLAEAPDERTKTYFEYADLDRSGKLNAAEWKMFIATLSAENALLAFTPGGKGDRTSALKWKYTRSVPQLPSVLEYKGILYMINDRGILTTLNPVTGDAYKVARLRNAADNYYACPVAGDNKVIFSGHSGAVTVLKAGAEQEVLSVNQMDDEIYATPAISGNHLFVRTRGMLYCFGQVK
jgi:outer membrane protein assembly factor BamB